MRREALLFYDYGCTVYPLYIRLLTEVQRLFAVYRGWSIFGLRLVIRVGAGMTQLIKSALVIILVLVRLQGKPIWIMARLHSCTGDII